MHELLLDISTRALTFSPIEMLFHTRIAGLVPLVIFVVESVHRFRIFSNALVSDRVDLMGVIFWPWDIFSGFTIREITFLPETHTDFIEVVSFLVCVEETVLYCRILVRHLLNHGPYARRRIEPRAFTHGEFRILKVSIGTW